MKKIKITNEKCFKLIILSIFIFGYSFREKYIPLLKDVNILFYFALSLLLFINRKNISRKRILGVIVLFIYNLFINYFTDSRINNVIYFNVQTIFPLLFLSINYNDSIKDNKENFICKIVNFYNIFVFILFLIYVIDIFTKCTISKTLTSLFTTYDVSWMANSVINARYHFFFAHPLYSSVLVMIFYILNLMCYKYKVKTNVSYWAFHGISALLLLSFGCKTPTIIFIILFFIFNFNVKRFITALFLSVIVYVSGNANFVINRFLNDDSLTSGRNEALNIILPELISWKNVFLGKGENLQFFITEKIGLNLAGASQEYPILVYYFRYGLIFTLLLLNYLIFSSIKKYLKKNNYTLVIGISAVFLEICMFNGITSVIEVQLVYMLFIVLMDLINLIHSNNANSTMDTIKKGS